MLRRHVKSLFIFSSVDIHRVQEDLLSLLKRHRLLSFVLVSQGLE